MKNLKNFKYYNFSHVRILENIRSMLHAINKYHNGLLNILDQLFVYQINEKSNEKTIREKYDSRKKLYPKGEYIKVYNVSYQISILY